MPSLHAINRLVACALLAGCLLQALTPAAAEATSGREPVVTTTTITDRDDTAGPLDVAAVSHAVSEVGTAGSVRFTVRLHDPIDAATLHRRHRLLIAELDTDGSSGAERNITVYARRGQVRADLISNASRKVLRRLHVRLLGNNVVRVRGPRDRVGSRRIFWYSLYHRTGDSSCGWDDGYPVTCSDSVPDDGWLRLPPAMWPSA